MPTSARWEVANSPKNTVKTVHSAGPMRRPQASFEAQPRIARLLAPKMGIDPYNAYRRCIRNSELLQVPREKSRKTEGVFLVALRDSVGKIEIPRARFLFVPQPLISESVIVLI